MREEVTKITRNALTHIRASVGLNMQPDRKYLASELGIEGDELESAINCTISDFCMESRGSTGTFLHAPREGHLKRAARYEKP